MTITLRTLLLSILGTGILFDILEETGGMNIPLRIPQGFRAAEKGNMNE